MILREYLGFQSDVLEVNGNGELKLNKLSSTTKRQLYVDDDGTISDGPTYSYYSAVNIDVFESFKHNITLPDGARIISIEVKYLDRSSSRQIAFFLTRRGFSNTVISDLTSFSSGNSFSNTQTQFETKQITGSQAIVNNETYAYTLTGSVNNSSSDQFALRITSYRIKYSFD